MPKIEKTINELARDLADKCLGDSGNYRNYSDEDLFNATEIFITVLMDKIFTENGKLSQKKMEELAETTGKAVRELIRACTGKDMHKIVEEFTKRS